MSERTGPDFGDISEDQSPEEIATQVEQAAERTYLIRRFHQNDSHPDHRTVVETGLTREEAKEHCNSDASRGHDESGSIVWFDGFEAE